MDLRIWIHTSEEFWESNELLKLHATTIIVQAVSRSHHRIENIPLEAITQNKCF